ncbi:MAG: class I SAM-dependent methyltransferase [Acidobacteria bacterium]|nr:class I SAM-dependent methyltransferase [Acidobacteriota bacterium]MDW7985116.1 methyltransferase domain-containing protein [Acidobacteriota bacterium]
MAGRGHIVVAVDLITNSWDGLGAHGHYDEAFLPVQAEFDRLPFAEGQFDVAVFNASLHYSTDYGITLTEALRVLHLDGRVVVMDLPVYRDAASGHQMVQGREAEFVRKYGFPSDAIPSEHYLTYGRLQGPGRGAGLTVDPHPSVLRVALGPTALAGPALRTSGAGSVPRNRRI